MRLNFALMPYQPDINTKRLTPTILTLSKNRRMNVATGWHVASATVGVPNTRKLAWSNRTISIDTMRNSSMLLSRVCLTTPILQRKGKKMNNTNKTAKRHTKKLYPALVSQRAMLNTKGWSDAALVSQSSKNTITLFQRKVSFCNVIDELLQRHRWAFAMP